MFKVLLGLVCLLIFWSQALESQLNNVSTIQAEVLPLPDLPPNFEYAGNDEIQKLLFQACLEGDLNLLQLYLTSSNVNEGMDTGGRSLLIWAARYNHVPILETLLKAGGNANAASIYGCTSLMWAGRNGNTEAIDLLLSYGAQINAVNDDGDTALHEAVRYNHEKAVRILIANGADITIRN